MNRYRNVSIGSWMILAVSVAAIACNDSSPDSDNGQATLAPDVLGAGGVMGSTPVAGGESNTPMGGALNPAAGGTVNAPSGGIQGMGGSPVSDVTDPPAFTMPNEAVACQRNESFEALLPILRGGRTHPTGRGEQAAVFDPCNRRIILFGGNDFQPEECRDSGPKRFQGDTWIYSLEHDNWARLDLADGPSPRGRHSMVFDSSRKRIYLFGGRFRPEEQMTGLYTMFNDVWAFDVNTDTWTQLETTGDGPSARGNTAMVYDDINDRLVLFGGSTSPNGLNFTPQADTYFLDLDSLIWRRHRGVAPEKRLFHSMAIDHARAEILMYGGGHEQAFFGDFYNDVWAFNLTDEIWERRWDGSGIGPDSRINPVLIEDVERQRIIMFAGHDETAVGHRNDVWAFDAALGEWTELRAGDTGTGEGCNSFCSCPPDFVQVDMTSPERRQYHTFTEVLGESRAILFGGKSDCGYLDDTWSFDFQQAEWTEIEPAGQGEACMRTGQEGCTDLCY